MKKTFINVTLFALLSLSACTDSNKPNSVNSGSEQENSTKSLNQDSIDKAHGHSHEPVTNQEISIQKDSGTKGNIQPKANQDSIDKAHGHKH